MYAIIIIIIIISYYLIVLPIIIIVYTLLWPKPPHAPDSWTANLHTRIL